MPRIRYLKPDFFMDEHLSELPFEHRLAFQGLWCFSDREGRLEDSQKKLKAQIFPYDNVDMEKILNDLTKKPFIHRYVVNGRRYLQIINFGKHQKPHHTEQKSVIPPKENKEEPLNNGLTTVETQEGMGMEKGMEKGMERYIPATSAGNVKNSQNSPKTTTEPDKDKPKTPNNIQKIVLGWKILNGIAKDDTAWDKVNFKANVSHAKNLLALFDGDVGVSLDAMEHVWETLKEKRGLDLSLAGVVRNVNGFRALWLEKKQRGAVV